MTRAPANLLAARKLLIDHLGPNVKPPAGVTILDPLGDPVWEVGIVPDAQHRGGYHCGSDRVVTNDYSVVESPRDRNGLTLDAAALDLGMFRVRTHSGTYDLRHYSRWMVAQCEAGTDDTRHIREVIYSPDGKTVRRWDRLKRRSSGDRSHLTHTHESYFRDAIKAGADVSAVKRRYLTTIGLIQGGEDMPFVDVEHGDRSPAVTYLQRCLEELRTRIGPKGDEPITVDGHYGDKTAEHVVAAERMWNPKFTGNGRRPTAETWVRIDRMLHTLRTGPIVRDQLLKLGPAPQPTIDYTQLSGAVDLAQLAARIDTARLVADLDYRRVVVELLSALPTSAAES